MIGAFLLLASITGLVGLIGITGLNSLNTEINTVVGDYWTIANAAMELYLNSEKQFTAVHEYMSGEFTKSKETYYSARDKITNLSNFLIDSLGYSDPRLYPVLREFNDFQTFIEGTSTGGGLLNATDSLYELQSEVDIKYQYFVTIHREIEELLVQIEENADEETGHNNFTVQDVVMEINIEIWEVTQLVSEYLLSTNETDRNRIQTNFTWISVHPENNNSILSRLDSLELYIDTAGTSIADETDLLFDQMKYKLINESTEEDSWNSSITDPSSGIFKLQDKTILQEGIMDSLKPQLYLTINQLDDAVEVLVSWSSSQMVSKSSTMFELTNFALITISVISFVVAVGIGFISSMDIIKPISKRIKVVFPAPFGPRRPKTSPFWIFNVKLSKATLFLNDLLSCSICSMSKCLPPFPYA